MSSFEEQVLNGTYGVKKKKKNESFEEQVLNDTYEEPQIKKKKTKKNTAFNKDVSKVLPLTNNQPALKNLSSSKNNNVNVARFRGKASINPNAQNNPLPLASEQVTKDLKNKNSKIKGAKIDSLLWTGLGMAVQAGKGIVKEGENKLDAAVQNLTSEKNPFMHLFNDDLPLHKRIENTGKSLLSDALQLSKYATPIGRNNFLKEKAVSSTSNLISKIPGTGSAGKNIKKYGETILPTGTKTIDKTINKLNKDITNESIRDRQKIAEEFIKRDLTSEALDKLGYNKKMYNGQTVQQYLDSKSLVRSDNLGGQIFSQVGQQLPSMMIGSVAGENGSLASLGVSSYGGSLEEAYRSGATRQEANKYGLLNAAIEVGTEKMFAGVGGLIGKGELDDVVKERIKDRIKNATAKKLADLGLDMFGEGFEELVGDALNPLAKKLTYAKKEDLMKLYKDQNYAEDFVTASLSTLVMRGMAGNSNVSVRNEFENSNIQQNQIEKEQKKKKIPFENSSDIIENNTQKQILPTNDKNVAQNQQINTQTNVDVETIENTIEKFKEIREQTNNKIEQSKITAHIEQLENEVKELTDNRNVFAQENKTILPISEQYKTNENMTLQESVEKYGYDPNAKVWKSIEETANKRGMKALMDDTYFSNNSEASIYTKDADGNRMIVYNPNASQDTIIQAKAIHELAHDLMSSDNSKNTLLNIQEGQKISDSDIVKYVEQFDDYAKARQDLEQIYATITDRNGNLVYDPNSTEFKQLIDEEVVAHVLEAKLGNQEFVNRLNGQKPNLARRIYNWVMDKIDNIGKSSEYKQEKTYWKNVANRFENAFNMEYNSSSNAASVRLSKNQTTREDFSKALDGDEWYNLYKKIDKHGIESKQVGSKNITVVNDKIVLSENDGTKPNVYDVYQGVKITDEIAEKFGLTTEDIIQDIYEIAEEENVDERKIKRSLEKYFNEGLLRRYDSNNNVFVSKNEYTGENSESNIRNIENESRGRKDLSRTNKTNRELNSSFSYDNEGNKLSKQQQEYFKDSKVRDENGNLEVVYHSSPNEFNVFDKNKIGRKGKNAWGSGFYFTPNQKYAQKFGDKTKQVYLNIINPYVVADEYELMNIVNIRQDALSNGYDLDDYLKEEGYDGLIVYDEDTDGNDLTEIIAFESNQIKNVDNINPTANEDIRYSKEAKEFNEFIDKNLKPTGTTGTLMAIHNLSQEKLQGILELGGFPVPSIAITNPNITNHKSFGDISVLFDKSTIDPAIKSNEVYDRDVWSPTFPTVDSEIIKDNLEKVADEIGIRDYYLEDYAERNSNIEDLIYTVLREDDVVNKYLDRNNINYDKDLSRKEIRQIAIDNGINEYLKDKLKDIFGEKGIYNGKEYITSSGKRRTFWQTHDKYNLANIVKILTRKSTINGQDTSIFSGGFGNIQANMSQRFNSIQEIKNAETRLKSTADNDIKPLQDNLSDSISKLTEYYGGYTSSNPFTTFSKVSEDIVDFASKKEQNISTLKEMLDEYGYKKVPDSVLKDIVKNINDLKNIPTDYFEAKPQRAVGLDEVEAIVIPNNTTEEFRKALKDAGLDFVEYDPNIEGDRQKVINKFDNLKFSKTAPGAWQDFVNKHFKSEGTQTKLKDIKLPTKEKTKLSTKEVAKKETKQIAPVKETKKEVKLPVKEIPKDPTKESSYDEKAYDKKKQHEKLIKQEVKAKVKGESQKAINIATKVGQKYLELDRTQKTELKEQLSKYTGKTRKQLTNSKTWNEIKDIVNKYAEKQITYVDNEIQDIKTEIKNTKIKIDDNIKSQITDYNDFRKDNFGKLKLSKDGVSLDSMYQELSEQYPYYFNNATTEADMLYELSDFMNKDTNMYEKIKLDDATLERATTKIYNSLLQNTMNKDAINELKEEIQKKYNKRTRKIVQKELQDRMGITPEDLQVGKDISSLEYQRTDPIRLHEKVFGYKIGKKINDATINFTKHQEAERIRFLNQERNEIKDLGIKPRSKESAAVQKYGEKQYVNNHGEVKKYGDADLQLEFPNEKTQQKIKHAASVIRAKYDSYIDNINEVITDMGYDPIPKRKDYMRHFMELNDKLSQWGIPLNRESLSQDALPTDINGITDQFKPGKNWFASTMQRKGLKTTYDAITGIDGYLEGASNLMYHTESIQRYRTLSKLVRDTYGQIHGMENIDASTEEGQQRLNDIMDNKLSKYAAWLDEQANALAGKKGGIDRAAERILGRKVYTVLDAAKKQVGSNMTGFNVRSAMTNFASAVQGASKTNKLAFVKGTVSTVKNMIHNDNLIDESDFLTSRFGSDQLSKKLWQKASNAGQIFMTGTDYFTANQIWRSKYYENLSKGMTKQQAIKNADDFAARIMGDRSKGSTAEIFNSKTLGLLTQFQLEVNNQWSSIIHDNKMDIKSGNKSGATALFQLGQLAAMSYLFNNFMKSVTGSDVMIDPIDILKQIFGGDDDDKSTEEKAQAVLGDLVNDLPFVSFLTGGRIPVSEAFVGPGTFTKKMTGQKDKYGNPIKWEDVKNDAISSGFYWLLPTGYGQIKKTTKGVSMYDPDLPVAGSYTKSGNLRFTADESTGGKIKAALFGQYTNDEAKKYTESGYKTINSTKIDEMKELGMKSSEYRDYRNGLAQAGTKNEDKIDYIVNLDNVTNKQKNIMASNFLSRDFDVKDYKKYDSYEEYNYAYHNPEKYNLITQITTYDKYKKYNEELKEIRDNTKNDKKETIKYINSLNLSIPQKAMYIKTYYKSFKQYDKQIVQYVNGKNLKISEKTAILEKLGFTVRNGRVY